MPVTESKDKCEGLVGSRSSKGMRTEYVVRKRKESIGSDKEMKLWTEKRDSPGAKERGSMGKRGPILITSLTH